MNSDSSRMRLLLLGEVLPHLLAELDVAGDPAADVLDERQPLVERLVDLGPFLFLLVLFVDRA